ncbi:MAG TPA: hypothetical protein VL128_04815 [Candidatus Eisenbacteria bacterium]|nr:hypothetical protein [Candidatus Eisenbacteria bacterium]
MAFESYFASTPEPPKRIPLGLPLNEYDCAMFYTFVSRSYTDYPV